MEKITLIATLTFGLEAVVKREVEALGFENIQVSDGKVQFDTDFAGLAKANLWLRTADRVLVKIGEFKALTFDALFEQTKALPWEQWIPQNGQFPVIGSAVKSTLGSVRACQAIVKKAVVDRLQTHYGVSWFEEDGPEYTIKISMLKDIATLTIDSSGSGLHRRGYRTHAGAAPLKETMAAALVQLSFWHENRRLLDPMCGSGTILIEAALMGRNIAPGLNRRFAAEQWPLIPQKIWDDARHEAKSAIITGGEMEIWGSDIDGAVIEASRQNAKAAGVGDDILFEQKDIHDLWIDRQYGILISNPPYGIKVADFKEINQIYISLHKMFRKKMGWSIYILTADKKFPDYFKRAQYNRVRKLFNGSLEVNYYQYYGERPPKE